MKKDTGEFLGLGGARLYMQSWKPDAKECKAKIILMHGGNNHCDLAEFNQLAKELVKNDFWVYSYDQRGFGRSEGRQMHMNCWEEPRGDFSSFIRYVKADGLDKKIFAFGISMGACLVMDQSIISPHLLDGAIAASFSTKPVNVPKAALFVINLLGKLFPKAAISAEPQPAFPGAKDLMCGTNLWHDPLCPKTLTLGNTRILFKRQKELASELKYIKIPLLHLQGTKDSITLPDLSIAEKIGTSDYTYIQYDSAEHNIFLNEAKYMVFEDIVNWVNERNMK